MRTLVCCGLGCVSIAAYGQAPIQLDTSFRTLINTWYVSSVLPLSDGDIIISGQLKFPGDLTFRSGAKLHSDGSLDSFFPVAAFMSGKLTAWNGNIYQGNGQIVRRSWPDGSLDPDFIMMNNGPYFSSLQGGDYHVYPDGRVLMSGVHQLSDTVRGFEGLYSLIWFSNTGYLDTTRTHRYCDGSISWFTELPDGKYLCSGILSTYESQPVDHVFRVLPNGALDTTFHSGISWGYATALRPLPDGRVYVGGAFGITGDPDTLNLVRMMPDGSLDPSFNNHIDMAITEMTNFSSAIVRSVHQLDAAHIVVMGQFEAVEGEVLRNICLLDTTGQLSYDHFTGPGCGNFTYQGQTASSIAGIVPAPDGSYYVYGAYHGYGDASGTDTTQRMISRLYGLDVGIPQEPGLGLRFKIKPNPSDGRFTADLDLSEQTHVEGDLLLQVFDAQGRLVERRNLGRQLEQTIALDLTTQPTGLYSAHLSDTKRILTGVRLVVE
jgi:uncharacterized delta-60 repeat protein